MTATVDDDSDAVWIFRRYLANAYNGESAPSVVDGGLDAYADRRARASTLEAEATRPTDAAAFVAPLRSIDRPRATEAPSDG